MRMYEPLYLQVVKFLLFIKFILEFKEFQLILVLYQLSSNDKSALIIFGRGESIRGHSDMSFRGLGSVCDSFIDRDRGRGAFKKCTNYGLLNYTIDTSVHEIKGVQVMQVKFLRKKLSH